MDGILRISEKCGRLTINGILSDTTSAFTHQPRLCCRKHRSLQHHPCLRAMINLQPRIRRPRCYSSGATGTPVAPTSDCCQQAQSPTFCALLTLPRTSSLALPQEPSPSCSILIFGRLLSQTTVVRSFLRETSVQTFFGRLQHGLTFGRPLSQAYFLYRFIFVRSLQSPPNIFCYGSVLFSVSV